MIRNISFQPARKEDYNVLWHLHKATIKRYVDKTWGWDEVFQKKYFARHFDAKDIQIIEKGDVPIGAVEIQDKGHERYIADFKICPEFQRQGVGTTILREIIEACGPKQNSINLQVLKVNPAKRLYEQFHFKVVRETKTHFIMKRSFA